MITQCTCQVNKHDQNSSGLAGVNSLKWGKKEVNKLLLLIDAVVNLSMMLND